MLESASTLRDLAFCPICGGRLRERISVDVLAACFVCDNDHYFYVPTEAYRRPSRIARVIIITKTMLRNDQPHEAATRWLKHRSLRAHINPQLAQLLRVVVTDRHRDAATKVGRFCPFCAEPLVPVADGDIWVRTVTCGNGHIWCERGGHLMAASPGIGITLEAEIPKETTLALMKSWLSDDALLAPQVPKSIRQVFEQYVQSHSSATP
jgi:hypothetical protein